MRQRAGNNCINRVEPIDYAVQPQPQYPSDSARISFQNAHTVVCGKG